jgi:hypothetical protein
MEIQHQGRRGRTQRIAVVLAAMLALALALAVSRVVVSSGPRGSQPSTGAGLTSTTSGPAYVLAPDAKDRNDRVSQPVEIPAQNGIATPLSRVIGLGKEPDTRDSYRQSQPPPAADPGNICWACI